MLAHLIENMSLRNHRLSDVVAAVCLPVTFILYLHLQVVSRDLQPDGSRDPQPAVSLTSENAEPRYSENLIYDTKLTAQHMTQFSQVMVSTPLNNSGRGREDLLLVTPIVRCGSSLMRNLLKLLRKENDFVFIDEPPKKTNVVHIPKSQIQKNIAGNISLINEHAAIFQSFAFIDFAKHGYDPPVYVSMVREPVSRAVSWFYSVRAPFQLVERQYKFPDTKLPSRSFLKKDIETCLKDRRDMECRYIPGRERLGHTLEFFCGHKKHCVLFGDHDSLHDAMDVVENNFAVVGILEEWEKTLAVLEHYVPRFFRGATKTYFENLAGKKGKINENFYKPPVELRALEAIKRNFSVEIEFYDYLRQRLNQQYLAITKPIT